MNSTGPNNNATIAIGNTIAEMRKVVDFVEDFGAAHKIPQTITNTLNLCLDELLNNTISYGYEDQDSHAILITLSFSGDAMKVEIQDDGKPFDPRKQSFSALKGKLGSRKISGLGIYFVKMLIDEIDYARKGQYNITKINKKL